MSVVTVIEPRKQAVRAADAAKKTVVYETGRLNVWYGAHQALKQIDLSFYEREITALIGPSGCGKSTYIKTLNRMIELVPNAKIEGDVIYRGRSVFDRSYPVEQLRAQVGMVFQKPNPFPKSIYDNIAYGPRIHGIRDRRRLDEIVEKACAKPRFGRKSKTGSMKTPSACRAANSSGSASPAVWRSNRTSF